MLLDLQVKVAISTPGSSSGSKISGGLPFAKLEKEWRTIKKYLRPTKTFRETVALSPVYIS